MRAKELINLIHILRDEKMSSDQIINVILKMEGDFVEKDDEKEDE